MENIKNEDYIVCPRCKQEVYKESIICPFCKFGIMAWLEGKIDENGELIKKETMGTVISVTKQWWLKVNRKSARVHAMDGAAFPHTIKVKYTIDSKDYICRKWIGTGNKVPDKGTTIKVTYYEDKPSKARIEL